MANRLIEKIESFSTRIALVHRDTTYTYRQLADQISQYSNLIKTIPAYSKVAILGDYSFDNIAFFFALYQNKHTIIPILTHQEQEEKLNESGAEYIFDQTLSSLQSRTHSKQYSLSLGDHAGLILFSSGSTGKPKAMLHNLDNLVAQFDEKKPKQLYVLLFLMFDHIGGINTMLNIFSTGQTAVIPESRKDIHHIASLIEKYSISVLPASPTFLNLMLLNKITHQYDLTSLRVISYGTEPMPEALLKNLRETFPKTKFLQTFGTSEVGIMHTQSENSKSLYMKISDPNIEYKIVDGELWIKSKTQVLGYLNASMECFVDGYFKTGDLVESKIINGEEYIRIIGRAKELINIGGEKVLPQEVEGLVLQIDGVLDCLVYGEKNAITGQSVSCEVVIDENKIQKDKIKQIIRQFCKGKIENYKIPSKVICKESLQASERFKKKRKLQK
ncbi:class I adenylate-forming enzyme family protein [Helicobacter pametensis]|uniref:class I adenylate-forming enzyme family protein n=1 Tax=Helicobacter pametensis TaxID=95149 RepID=UPI00047FC588|nr:fatty acid--CoA ligase family protein [Helicobacter pametensis]